MTATRHSWLKKVVAAAGIALLAACATPPPPPPPPPPAAPEPEPVPAQPEPPNGAAADTPVPPLGPDGVRQTVNANLSPAQITWNLRSGLNVAALNCLSPQDAPILGAYKTFLERHEKQLAATNRALDGEFRQIYGGEYHTERDRYMTRVYNYFALPPAQDAFCAAALRLSLAYLQTPPEDVDVYAVFALPKLEAAFLQFFADFERYRVALAAWDSRYGPQYAAAQPADSVPVVASLALVQPLPGQPPFADVAAIRAAHSALPAPIEVVDVPPSTASPAAAMPEVAISTPSDPIVVPVTDSAPVVQMVSQPVVQPLPAGEAG